MNPTHRRIVRRRAAVPPCRRAKVGGEEVYESMSFRGFFSAELIPPESHDSEYQIIQCFATESVSHTCGW